MKSRQASRPLHHWLIAIVVAVTPGCSETIPTAPTSHPPAARSTAAFSPSGNSVPAAIGGVAGVYSQEITTTRSGTATVWLSWPNADVSLELYLTTGDCSDSSSLVARSCDVLGYARPGNPPTMVSAPVSGNAKYIVWVLNPDHIAQAVALDIDIQ